jgi:hypothetical protein
MSRLLCSQMVGRRCPGSRAVLKNCDSCPSVSPRFAKRRSGPGRQISGGLGKPIRGLPPSCNPLIARLCTELHVNQKYFFSLAGGTSPAHLDSRSEQSFRGNRFEAALGTHCASLLTVLAFKSPTSTSRPNTNSKRAARADQNAALVQISCTFVHLPKSPFQPQPFRNWTLTAKMHKTAHFDCAVNFTEPSRRSCRFVSIRGSSFATSLLRRQINASTCNDQLRPPTHPRQTHSVYIKTHSVCVGGATLLRSPPLSRRGLEDQLGEVVEGFFPVVEVLGVVVATCQMCWTRRPPRLRSGQTPPPREVRDGRVAPVARA